MHATPIGAARRPSVQRTRRLQHERGLLTLIVVLVLMAGTLLSLQHGFMLTIGERGDHPNPYRVLLLVVLPRCAADHGQFFLTKALQTKNQFARAMGWETWPVSTPSDDANWPALLLQLLAIRPAPAESATGKPTWYVWTDPEALAMQPMVLPWSEWSASGTHLVFTVAEGGEDRRRAAVDGGIGVGSVGLGGDESTWTCTTS